MDFTKENWDFTMAKIVIHVGCNQPEEGLMWNFSHDFSKGQNGIFQLGNMFFFFLAGNFSKDGEWFIEPSEIDSIWNVQGGAPQRISFEHHDLNGFDILVQLYI